MIVIAIDVLRGRSIKILGAGSAMLFTAIGAWLTLVDPDLSNSVVKLAVDSGMFAISLARWRCASPSRCNMRAKSSMPRPPDCPAS